LSIEPLTLRSFSSGVFAPATVPITFLAPSIAFQVAAVSSLQAFAADSWAALVALLSSYPVALIAFKAAVFTSQLSWAVSCLLVCLGGGSW
jgi:hypothetical protein